MTDATTSATTAAAAAAAVAAADRPADGAPEGLLTGVTVLDLASVGPAARCTRILSDYGATVVKVGAVPGRGAAPVQPPFYAYSGARYQQRVAIDLKDPGGRQAFLALVAGADVVVESFRPGVLDRLEVGFDVLTTVNPSVILCSTTGYGQDGPRAGWAGHDLDYLAVGGYLATTEPRGDGGPPVPGATIADAAGGGMHAALAVLAALVARARGEGPVHLDVAIAEGVLWLTSLAVDEHLATGDPVGHGHNIITGRYACYGTYRAADGGWLAVGAIEPKFFANLCRHLGCEEWIPHQLDDDAQDGIRTAFRTAFASRPRDQWVELLSGADTCVAPVLGAEEVVGDPQFAARGAFTEAVVGGQGPRAGSRFRQVAPVLAGMVPPAGPVALPDPEATDTDRLLAAAGLAPEQIEDLRARGAVA